jgi:hypothetical protein
MMWRVSSVFDGGELGSTGRDRKLETVGWSLIDQNKINANDNVASEGLALAA